MLLLHLSSLAEAASVRVTHTISLFRHRPTALRHHQGKGHHRHHRARRDSWLVIHDMAAVTPTRHHSWGAFMSMPTMSRRYPTRLWTVLTFCNLQWTSGNWSWPSLHKIPKMNLDVHQPLEKNDYDVYIVASELARVDALCRPSTVSSDPKMPLRWQYIFWVRLLCAKEFHACETWTTNHHRSVSILWL